MIHPIVIESAGGEYMDSVVVIEWTRKPGEKLEAGETIVVVETAKAATEVPASHSGYLKEIFFEAGQEAPVGALLGNISETLEPPAPSPKSITAVATPASESVIREEQAPAVRNDRVVATPLARRIAAQRDVDLKSVKGTGPRGRIKLRDVEAVVLAGQPADRPARPITRSTSILRDKAPIVLLHGFGADRSAWRQITPLLDSGHQIIMPELPGHGSAAEIPISSIEDIAFAISDQLQEIGVEEAHIVGHSLGGATALALSQIGRLSIRSLCLIAPGGLGPEIDIAFLNGLTRANQVDSLKPWLDRMVANSAIIPDGMARAILRQREKTDIRQAQNRLLEVLFPDGTQIMRLKTALDEIKVPAKIIWGLKDVIIPPAHAFAASGSVGLHLLRDIGHVPQMECPELVARLINELVRSNA